MVSEEAEDAEDGEEDREEAADPGDGIDSVEHSEVEAGQTEEQLVWRQQLELTAQAGEAESQHQ